MIPTTEYRRLINKCWQ